MIVEAGAETVELAPLLLTGISATGTVFATVLAISQGTVTVASSSGGSDVAGGSV